MQVPTSGGPLRFLPQFLVPSPTLNFLRRGVISARGGFGVLSGGTHSLGNVITRGPRGTRTWNVVCEARSVQGPLSAAARINTARPWGQISLPKSPWPPRRWREQGRGGIGRPPSHAGPALGKELVLPMEGSPPGLTLGPG